MPDACVETCGDGVITSSEICEDGDGGPFNGDGCSALCQIEPSFTCTHVLDNPFPYDRSNC